MCLCLCLCVRHMYSVQVRIYVRTCVRMSLYIRMCMRIFLFNVLIAVCSLCYASCVTFTSFVIMNTLSGERGWGSVRYGVPSSLIHSHVFPLLLPCPSACLRVAMNADSILQDQLGVISSTNRKKLQLRAMDLILFGPPTREDM